MRTTLIVSLVSMVAGCSGAAATAGPSSAAPSAPPSAAALPSAEVEPPVSAPASPAPGSEESTAVSTPETLDPPPAAPPVIEPVPPLVDDAGQTLPQTEDRPSGDSPSLRRRLELLVEAIRDDDPERALPSFFPVQAYAEVKAIQKPERDWEHRLVGAFRRNIHEYHKQLGANAEGIEFVGIDIPEANVKLMEPNTEGNRLSYFRVLRSGLRVKKPDGTESRLEVTSMISWRGEWYVVHLNGFK